MSKGHLSPCPSCSRHVRVSESSCPHCGVATSEEFRARPAPRAPQKRLNRTALYAVGVGTIALASACSSTDGATNDSDAGKGRLNQSCVGDEADCNMGTDYGAPPLYEGDATLAHDGDAADGGSSGDAALDAPVDLDAAEGGPTPDSSM